MNTSEVYQTLKDFREQLAAKRLRSKRRKLAMDTMTSEEAGLDRQIEAIDVAIHYVKQGLHPRDW